MTAVPSWVPEVHVQKGGGQQHNGQMIIVACPLCHHHKMIVDFGQKVPCEGCGKCENMTRLDLTGS